MLSLKISVPIKCSGGAMLRNAREIGAGGLCPPLSDNLKAKML
jgi:hypothetical protein